LPAAGLALINTGLGRVHSAAHTMLASVLLFGVAGGVYFRPAVLPGKVTIGLPAHSVSGAGKSWNLLAAQPFFFRHLPLDDSPASRSRPACRCFTVGLAALIPLGAGIDRLETLAPAAFPPPCWPESPIRYSPTGSGAGGWLAQLGVNYGMGHGFLDAGGAGTIQVVGGLTALSIAWMLESASRQVSLPKGSRRRFPTQRCIRVALGCLLALVGWLGLNSAGAVLFYGVESGRAVLISLIPCWPPEPPASRLPWSRTCASAVRTSPLPRHGLGRRSGSQA